MNPSEQSREKDTVMEVQYKGEGGRLMIVQCSASVSVSSITLVVEGQIAHTRSA